jgi:hypothetical protein
VPNEMETSAAAAKISQTVKFSQVALLHSAPAISAAVDNPSGICYGLAWVWMEYKAKNNYSRFFNDVNAWQDKATTLKAAGIYRVVQAQGDNTAKSAAACGLAVAMDGEGDSKSKTLAVNDPSDMKKLTDWMGAAMGDRYFLIQTGAHAMAASGSKVGNLEFFDPNFGVVSCFSSSSMAGFFNRFFNAPRIKDGYWRAGQGGRNLSVTKIKKA